MSLPLSFHFIDAGSGSPIWYNFIDANGQTCDVAWNKRVISVALENLKKIPVIVGVAYGVEKLDAIRAALSAQLVNVLVTDYATASQLVHGDD
ncbi:sugar-binding domain-containing protein [Alicyclobacillus sp. ALC3]|uniref:sugar-binding domain-containing protein n=1 Tax=Alicyclobacillus sp. ALC3 TaxID=2796143 RepID=UPI0027A3B480|nr:hypothetical protein JC200_10665 [Alicyclobacillus sp. ALC3]